MSLRTRSSASWWTLLLLAPSQPSAAPPAAPTRPVELVDKVINAYGGASRLNEIRGYRMSGTVRSQRGETGRFTRVVNLPDRLQVELQYPSRTELRLLVGQAGWRGDASGLAPAEGPMLVAMMLQLGRASLPWVLLTSRDSVVPAPAYNDGIVSYEGLSFELGPGMFEAVWMDPETHLVVRSEASMTNPPMNFAAMYSDYRRVSGIPFAHGERTYAGSVQTSTMNVDSIDLGVVPTLQAPPPAGSSG